MQRKKLPKQLREAKKAHDATLYKEGFDDGYRAGILAAMQSVDKGRCPACSGTGTVLDTTCKRCKGSGREE